MIDNFSGLIGLRVTDSMGLSGTIRGLYLRHKGILLFVFGDLNTELVFILQDARNGKIIEIEAKDFYKDFRVIISDELKAR